MNADLAHFAERLLPEAASRKWRRYAFALLLVAAAVAASAAWIQFLGARNLAVPYMSALVVAGGWLGLRPALAATIPAFLAHKLLSPMSQLGLSLDARDLLILAAFVATAAMVGGIAGRLSERARLAAQRQRRLAAYMTASRDLAAAGTPAEVARKLVQHLEGELGVHAAVWANGPDEPLLAASESAQETAQSICSAVQAGPISGTGDRWTILKTSRGVVGVATLWLGDRPICMAELQWIDALFQLGAIALDRAALAVEVSADALTRADGLLAVEAAA